MRNKNITRKGTAGLPLSRRAMLKTSLSFVAGAFLPHFHIIDMGPTAPKRIYIAPDDHTDYFWTADGETYEQAFLEMLDYYLDLADETEHLPSDYQSRWNCDGTFWLWVYARNRSEAEFERLISRIKDGHISVPLNPLVILWGGTPAEAVLRGMYYAGKIERRHDLRIRLVYSMENQTLPYGLISLWAGSGGRYSWKGICNCTLRISRPWDREHEIYWWAGPDDSRILMKWNSLLTGDNQSMGGYAEARYPDDVVEYVDGDEAFIARYPYRVVGAFGRGWDDLKTLTDEFVETAQEKSNDARRVIVSNEEDFFEDFEATYGSDLPVHAGSFGNEWELYCTSMAEVSARVKRLVEKLRGAEAMATLVGLHDPDFMDGREEARDLAWMNLGLYWEHNWTADGLISRDVRAEWQRQIADEIEEYIEMLHHDAAHALAGMIRKSETAANLRFFAFNPLNWARTDIADLRIDGIAALDEHTPFHVIDLTTGEEIPSQIVYIDGTPYLRILAQNVPPAGYKVFEVRPGAGRGFEDAAQVNGDVIENEFFRVTLAGRGAITSLIDKRRGDREFIREINERAANDLGSGSGDVWVANAGPVSVTLVGESRGPIRHTSAVTLLRGLDRIDIRNEIEENFGGVYTWAFSFNLDTPDIWHEEVGAVVRARLTTEGGHYSPRNARYDWLTLNHFAALSGDNGVGVALSNADCYYMQVGESAPDYLDTGTPQISALAGGQVDGPEFGIPNQGGDDYFLQRFALRTFDRYNPVDAMRFALGHQNPLVTEVVTGGDVYPETAYGLVELSNPNVLLWAMKPADDDPEQIIVRLWNLASEPANFQLRFPDFPILEAQETTHIETPLQSANVAGGALSESIGAHQMKTFACVVAGAEAVRAARAARTMNEGE
ncbi:MAG: glycoside hydrolase [Anaerolineae bacterium]|nr:glycoside hydrolase [Anaerolineae bacterium]